MPKPDWISTDDALFIVQGQSITVASCDIRHVPSISRGLACRISGDAAQLIVLVSRRQSETLLADIASSGQVAVVITRPSTHKTLQIKGTDAVITPIEGDDLAILDASRCHFGADILTLGFSEDFNHRLFHVEPGDLCRICFTPADVFKQTPGPDAGTRIGPQP